ncbi:MAG: histidine kinase [Butyrivibrio sp.]|nr:histidine kinase [Butyrivibrio sp.]
MKMNLLKKYKSKRIGTRVSIMMAIALTTLFFIGLFFSLRLQIANMQFIFDQSTELLASTLDQIDYQIDDIDSLLYRVVTSHEVQKSGSHILSNDSSDNPSALTRQIELNNITEQIRQIISANPSITCAQYVDELGVSRTIAISSYISIPASDIQTIREAANEADGETLLFDGSAMTGKHHTLILAKAIREKQNISMKHIGTLIVYVDILKLCSPIIDSGREGIIVIKNDENNIEYTLCNIENFTTEDAPPIKENSYEIVTIGGKEFFGVYPDCKDRFFDFILYTPYLDMFSYVNNSFSIFIFAYFFFLILAIITGVHVSKRITQDLQNITAHISSISKNGTVNLTPFDTSNLTDHDSIVLAESFNTMTNQIMELIDANYKNEILIKETRLRELQAQMNPHFLYNTLNSLYWMAKSRKNEAAAQMVSSLGILLREAISNEQIAVPLSKELDVLSHYFTIQKQRYENRLETIIKVCPDVECYMVPKFSLQPLVENAITYGLENMLDTCTIEVKACTDDDNHLYCSVINNGPAPEDNLMEKLYSGEITPKGNGIGLKNIDLRIKAIYGDNYGVSIERENDKTIVKLSMECITQSDFDMRINNNG